ncbi:MFS transporter small subunit [Chitinimonas sp. BJB300]|nr:oxalate:formate antiporter [Chitinimonas sp. BJB300]TSJ90108.1 oxalate:formate antiporter [Chitinimonas sp. BJB300]
MTANAKGVILWLYVSLPLVWGVYQTLRKTMALFN